MTPDYHALVYGIADGEITPKKAGQGRGQAAVERPA